MLESHLSRNNLREHIIAINNQMTIVGTFDSLKCKHTTRHASNTIVGGFVGGETSLARK